MEVIFPPKVSGFYERKDGPPQVLPLVEIQEKLGVLNGVGATWYLIDLSSHSNYSYHCCHIQWDGQEYFFFMNKYYYLGAFSLLEDTAGWKNWQKGQLLPRNHYTDVQALANILSPPWTILSEDMLIQQVDADNEISQKIVMELQDAEFAEFSYWEPKNMGNILFNNWEKY